MKKVIIAALLLIAMQAQSQSFEGTIKWSMKMDITDPKLKAQMEQNMKLSKDPAMQAKIKEAQEQMNDPQMKAMMDANPQLKAQMESAIKMMQGGGGSDMSSMMPKGFLLKVKSGNTLTQMEGGMMQMEMLFLKDQNKTVSLNRKDKTYSIMPVSDASTKKATQSVKVTKTNETMKIQGYSCSKYIAAVTENDETVNQIYWTTTDIKDFDLKSLSNQRMGRNQQQFFYDGIEGVPLKIEMSMQEAKMVMEVTEIKRETLSSSDFVIPSDFKETQGMFGR